MLFAIYVLVAIAAIILHFTGHLERWRMEWIVIVLAITIFPAVIICNLITRPNLVSSWD